MKRRMLVLSAMLFIATVLISGTMERAQAVNLGHSQSGSSSAAARVPGGGGSVAIGPIVGGCPGVCWTWAYFGAFAIGSKAIGYARSIALCWDTAAILTVRAFAFVSGKGSASAGAMADPGLPPEAGTVRVCFDKGVMLKVNGTSASAHFNYTVTVDAATFSQGTATWDGTTLIITGDWFGIPWEVSGKEARWPKFCNKKYFDIPGLVEGQIVVFTCGCWVHSAKGSWAAARNVAENVPYPYPVNGLTDSWPLP